MKPEVNKLSIKNLYIDMDIYPRKSIIQSLVESYAEALKAGAIFPPIKVQKIIDGNEEKIVVLDGVHRVEAHKKCKIREIDAFFWNDKILDKDRYFEDLLTEATIQNREHGHRLEDRDLITVCLKIINSRPINRLKGLQKQLADRFGVSESWVSQKVGKYVESRRRERDIQIYQLSKDKTPQTKIAEQVGLSQSTVSDIIEKITSKETDKTRNDKALADLYDKLDFVNLYYLPMVARLSRLWGEDQIDDITEKIVKHFFSGDCILHKIVEHANGIEFHSSIDYLPDQAKQKVYSDFRSRVKYMVEEVEPTWSSLFKEAVDVEAKEGINLGAVPRMVDSDNAIRYRYLMEKLSRSQCARAQEADFELLPEANLQ